MTKATRLAVPLNTIPIDDAVAQRLPARLADYYCALPIAEDEGRISVVMAHGDDAAAIGVIQSLLGAPITPIQGTAREIRAALRKVWANGDSSHQPARILCWGNPDAQSAAHLQLIADSLQAHLVPLDSAVHTIEDTLKVAHAGHFSLVAIHAPQGHSLSDLARKASTPLLLLGEHSASVQHILLVLRGHSPDHRALDWIIPLAQAAQAKVTLLYVATPLLPFYTRETRRLQGVAMLLSPDSESGTHVLTCADRLREASIEGFLKLRQGPPEQQIANEIEQGSYDFIAVAAEAHGDFVQQVLGEVEGRALHSGRPILVMKPVIP